MPTIILGFFLLRCTNIEALDERMANTAITLLAYIEIFGQLRLKLPPLASSTVGEKFILVFIFACMLPLIENGKTKEDRWLFWYLTLSLICIPILYAFLKLL